MTGKKEKLKERQNVYNDFFVNVNSLYFFIIFFENLVRSLIYWIEKEKRKEEIII